AAGAPDAGMPPAAPTDEELPVLDTAAFATPLDAPAAELPSEPSFGPSFGPSFEPALESAAQEPAQTAAGAETPLADRLETAAEAVAAAGTKLGEETADDIREALNAARETAAEAAEETAEDFAETTGLRRRPPRRSSIFGVPERPADGMPGGFGSPVGGDPADPFAAPMAEEPQPFAATGLNAPAGPEEEEPLRLEEPLRMDLADRIDTPAAPPANGPANGTGAMEAPRPERSRPRLNIFAGGADSAGETAHGSESPLRRRDGFGESPGDIGGGTGGGMGGGMGAGDEPTVALFRPAGRPRQAPAPEPISAQALSWKMDARTPPDQILCAAAWLTYAARKPRFSRKEVFKVIDGIPSESPRNLEVRVKGFGRLVRDGALVQLDADVFTLSEAELERTGAYFQ
ncbi:MAG: hypothetical protein AAF074_11885, partial [Pseudomonadota bacterium]